MPQFGATLDDFSSSKTIGELHDLVVELFVTVF